MSTMGNGLTLMLGLSLAGCGGTGNTMNTAGPAPSGERAESGVAARVVSTDRSHYESVVDMIRGRAPGLHVMENQDGTIQVRIRGSNQSFQETAQEPLVVIDGVPSARPAGQALMALNPNDVSSIQVLRDVSSTAIYGTRGANGVILVQLKRR